MFTSAAILQEVANNFKRKQGFYCIDEGLSSLYIHYMTLASRLERVYRVMHGCTWEVANHKKSVRVARCDSRLLPLLRQPSKCERHCLLVI